MEVKNILVTDDSLLGRMSVKKAVSHLDFNILEAVDGYDALIQIDSKKPDIIFLDLLMPKVDGFTVLEEMQKRNIKIPVIVVSADIQDSTIDRCTKLGAFGYLNKPIERIALDKILDKVYEL